MLRDTEKLLQLLLRFAGSVLLLATVGAILPREWMAAAHRLLGLGEMSPGPLVEYLARSASLLYAIHGGALWACSFDVRRHRPVIAYLGASTFAFGFGVHVIDIFAGLPWYWTALEGPPTAAMGAATLMLALRLDEP
ncbi:MAG: hypothetical protein ACKVS9_05845 [Phycisphaerae bacterium]